MKKIAFVHDWIVHEGGAEAVLKSLISRSGFDDAKIFVLFSTHKQLRISNFELPVITALPTWINNIFVYFNSRKIPTLSKLFDYRNLVFWFPLLCRLLRKKIEKYGAEEIIISSFAAAKNIVLPRDPSAAASGGRESLAPKTTLYLHSPMQYIRENYADNYEKLKFPIKQFYWLAATYLRPRDKKSRRYDVVLCNSNYTAKLAKQLCGIEGHVEYPALDNAFMDEPIVDIPKEYFVFVGRVQRYVREIDRITQLCNVSKQHLIVIGSGPDIEYAKSLAGPTILFVGHIQDAQEKIKIMKYARGIINLAKESFGIATAEALCLGVPVFGYNAGATPELVNSNNGMLVDDKSAGALLTSLKQFLEKDYNRKDISENARRTFFP